MCGKVGVANADKGLRRHLRLIHNISVSKDFCVGDYFEPTDPDAVIEILSDSRDIAFLKPSSIPNVSSGLYIHQWLMDK